MPRWVKGMVLVGILLAVAFIVLHLTGLSPAGH
jgi:hypothetical protein